MFAIFVSGNSMNGQIYNYPESSSTIPSLKVHVVSIEIFYNHIDGTKSGVLSSNIMMPIIDMPTTIHQSPDEQGR